MNKIFHFFAFLIGLTLLISCEQPKQKIDLPATDLSTVALIPKPLKTTPTHQAFALGKNTSVISDTGFDKEIRFLSEEIQWRTDLTLGSNTEDKRGNAPENTIQIVQSTSESLAEPESYELKIKEDTIAIHAQTPEAAFRGIQTLLQLIPEKSNDTLIDSPLWILPTGNISDKPTFGYRGTMLDVARHFFTVSEVKKYIDLIAYYKLNVLHLHLTDDQGWRIEIKSWPKLTEIGSTSEVGGGPGGFYTQEEYKDLVAYAAERHIMIIPEVDMPGHTNAASLSYPLLHAGGKAETPRVRTDMKVGYSSLHTRKDTVYAFLDDVIGEIAALTPGPYFHIGGDESAATGKKDYIHFVEKVEKIVHKHGKQMVGWNEIAQAKIDKSTIAQLWNEPHNAIKAASGGSKIILSPANKAYLDMKYDTLSEYGLTWAAYIPVDSAYIWNPLTHVKELSKESILGIEAPLWSETISNSAELEYLAFPRIIGYAELGWSDGNDLDWDDYKKRVAQHKAFLERKDVNFYPSSKIPWQEQ